MTAPVEQSSWVICQKCGRLIYGPRFERNLKVCGVCGQHHPLTAHERLATILDPGTWHAWEPDFPDTDPLAFADRKPYRDRIQQARAATGLREAIVLCQGEVSGVPVTMAILDFRFMGGSLGSAVGEGVLQACQTAVRDRTPLIIVSASGGARMQEGVVSLLQMAKTAHGLTEVGEAGLPSVSLITDPTYGGVAASFATLCDVIIAEPDARLGFAGRRVIEQTIKETLPKDFQTAEFLLAHGLIDHIVPRGELRSKLSRLLRVVHDHPGEAPEDTIPENATPEHVTAEGASPEGATAAAVPVVTNPRALPERDPWEVVKSARRLDRPTTLDYAAHMLDDFVELHGDRLGQDCSAIVAGLGTLRGRRIALIGTQKGHTGTELAAHNFGMATPAGYRKAARVMRLADKLRIPVVTLIDTAGAYPGPDAEEQGQAMAIAESIQLMSDLRVPTVAVVTGEGGSGGALALASADRVFVLSNATYSVITAEGCASILWRDAAAAPQAAAALRLDPASLLHLGVIDGVVEEPAQGAESDHLLTADRVARAVSDALAELDVIEPDELVEARRRRYLRIGRAEHDALSRAAASAPPEVTAR